MIHQCTLTSADATRANARRRSRTIGEPYPHPQSCPFTPQQIRELMDWMDVEKSVRWQPSGNLTYCNVYASDLLHLAGIYLPRVWWRDPNKGYRVAVYGDNCREMSANSLHDWMLDYGHKFGWRVVAGTYSLRDLLNAGQSLGVIIGRRKDRSKSGHITVCLPDSVKDIDGDGPLQTQAGTTNKQYFKDDEWYKSRRFDSVVFAYNG